MWLKLNTSKIENKIKMLLVGLTFEDLDPPGILALVK